MSYGVRKQVGLKSNKEKTNKGGGCGGRSLVAFSLPKGRGTGCKKTFLITIHTAQ